MLTDRVLPGVKLRTASCRALLEAWLAWRGDRPLPRHADLDPGSIKKILPHSGVVDVRAKDVAIYRIAGSGLRDVFGFDPTGKNVVDLVPAEFRLLSAYRTFVPATWPCGYTGVIRFGFSGDVTDLYEVIGLPLAASDPDSRNLLIFTLESVLGRRWQKRSSALLDTPENEIVFIDIGAGAPATSEPPADFLATAK